MGLSLPAEETIRLATLAGFGGVDLMVRDLVDAGEDPKVLRRRLDDLGLRGGAFPLPVHWRGDSAEFSRDLARLPVLAEAAATLGITRTGTWIWPEIPNDWGDPDREDSPRREAAVTLHRDRLGAIARILDRFGVQLGLEVIGVASVRRGGEPFVTRLADLDRVLGPWRNLAPNLGILVDGFHLHAAGEPAEAALAWGVDHVVWVHVADLPAGAPTDRGKILDHERGLPGEHGAVQTAGLLRVLSEAGYEGPVTAEPMGGCRGLRGLDPPRAVQRTADALQSVWPEPIPAQRDSNSTASDLAGRGGAISSR